MTDAIKPAQIIEIELDNLLDSFYDQALRYYHYYSQNYPREIAMNKLDKFLSDVLPSFSLYAYPYTPDRTEFKRVFSVVSPKDLQLGIDKLSQIMGDEEIIVPPRPSLIDTSDDDIPNQSDHLLEV